MNIKQTIFARPATKVPLHQVTFWDTPASYNATRRDCKASGTGDWSCLTVFLHRLFDSSDGFSVVDSSDCGVGTSRRPDTGGIDWAQAKHRCCESNGSAIHHSTVSATSEYNTSCKQAK